MPALDRYDGPMWRTLRAQLDRNPVAARAVAANELQIWVLSALYGFVPASVPLHDYDLKMTPNRLAKMSQSCAFDFQCIPGKVDDADAVLFAGGELYRDAMWKASGNRLNTIMKISETDGPGIGHHRAQLGAWLSKQYPAEAMAT